MALINRKKAAALLDVSPSYLSKHPEIPHHKLPGTGRPPVRYDEEEILAWAKSQPRHGAPSTKVHHRNKKYRLLQNLQQLKATQT